MPGLFRLTFLALVLGGIALPDASAQELDLLRSRYSPAAYYKYEQQGDITIVVHAMGNVRYPGLHEIAAGSRMSRLLSLAGGPTLGERRDIDERTIVIRLYREGAEGPSLVFETQMMNDLFAPETDPVLQAGDMLTVESTIRQGYTWRELLPIISTAASLAVIVLQFAR